jgi:hypothetical protein
MNRQQSFQEVLDENNKRFLNYMESIINELFGFSNKAGNYRGLILQLSFIFIWILLAITMHTPGDLSFRLLKVLDAYPLPIIVIFNHILALLFAWDVVLILAALFTGYFIALQVASIYVADIFELKDQSIAEEYIKQAAFANQGFLVIHIEDGVILAEDRKSPISRIGGPGHVQINLENAVIFEKYNGKPNICGPTVDDLIELEGFERIRKIIDLRDQTTTFNITSRTRDGIPLEIKDIRLIFSVFRDTKFVTLTRPYPFSDEALHWLIYQQGSGPWTTSLTGMVRGELANFISQHSLGEILATIGEPEINHEVQLQKSIARTIRKNWAHARRYKVFHLLYVKQKRDGPKYLPIYFWQKKHPKKMQLPKLFCTAKTTKPDFATRNKISKIFYDDFSHSFKQRAKQKGVRLEWINVGTWYAPNNFIPEQYQNAWKQASENIVKSNPKVLNEVFIQNRTNTLIKHFNNLPLFSFIQLHEADNSRQYIIDSLIDEYASKLKVAVDSYIQIRGRVPKQIENSLAHIRKNQISKYKNNAYFIGEYDQDTDPEFEEPDKED